NRFTIEIASLAGTTPGAAANFVASVPREWEFVTYQQLAGTFSRDLFTLDVTGFTNPLGAGYFDIVQTTTGLAIAFIPEPSTLAMLLAALPLLLARRRR
ncbi:MAG: PEP-CTERM sorting domain-containing protein, partial [Patescibacteria group bacterium]|nr:PEP-CTERM sorting domain-containing protein [Patescibacteria group bacterium]